jgi:hypothetical protein
MALILKNQRKITKKIAHTQIFLHFSSITAYIWQFGAVLLQQISRTSVLSATITSQIRIYLQFKTKQLWQQKFLVSRRT